MLRGAKKFWAELWAERINYGGTWATRREVWDHAYACGISRGVGADRAAKGAEMFAFRPKSNPLTDSECASMLAFHDVPESMR